MINGFFHQLKDKYKFEDLNKPFITGSATSESTKAIMDTYKVKLNIITVNTPPITPALSNRALIEAIERFNVEYVYSLADRVRYQICIGGDRVLDVQYAYFIEENPDVVVVVSFDRSGYADYKWDDSSIPNIKEIKQRLATVVVNLDSISDIQFGSYDSEDCKIFDNEYPLNVSGMNIVDLTKKIKELKDETFRLKSTGKYRSLITKFNYMLKNIDLPQKIYSHHMDIQSYNDYSSAWVTYLSVVEEIVGDFLSPNCTVDGVDIRKFKYFKTEDELEVYVNGDNSKRERSFTHAELTIYKAICGVTDIVGNG